ncbi:MAG: TraM recognition domain-containing protein [Verrucomicrobiales bacterium]
MLQSLLSPELTASSIVNGLKHVWHDSWGPRLEYILFASVASLAHCKNSSFIGINRLLTDEAYRDWVVRQVKDPILQLFWEREFSSYNSKFTMEAISPILNKVGQILMSPALRNVLGQVNSKIELRQVLDRKQIFIANLSKGLLGQDKSAILGSFLVSQFELAALSRANIALSERTPYSLYVDEFQSFASDSFSHILSESRKYGLQLTLSNQYLDQLSENIRSAIFGNIGTILAFRVGNSDASVLEHEFGGEILAQRLSELRNHTLFAKILQSGESSSPFLVDAHPPLGRHYGRNNAIKRSSQERFAEKRSVVENKIQKWLSTPHF